MTIAIEVPVFKGEFLQQCIDSVLNQTNDAWQLWMVWDGGDQLSYDILKRTEQLQHPKIHIYFNENQGIAKARAFISSKSTDPYMLALDDDDELAPNAVDSFLRGVEKNPWASLIRAKRGFINQQSEHVEKTQWFPFGPRNYDRGMVTDLFNQAQPYLIRRSAYDKTLGWRGFDDFMQAGEDCDIFLQLEEIAHFELIDEVLYHYRLHDERASVLLTSAAAFEMWRRLADDAIQRMELPLVRTSDTPPFTYKQTEQPEYTIEHIDFVLGLKSPHVNNLKSLGIQDNAIKESSFNNSSATWRMNGFRQTNNRLVCFLNDDISFDSLNPILSMIDSLNSMEADIIGITNHNASKSPKKDALLSSHLLLVKREVLLATGGFDEEFVPHHLQSLDFSLQCIRRDFRCYEMELLDIAYDEIPNQTWSKATLEPLLKKWYSHPALLSLINESNSSLGEGARL